MAIYRDRFCPVCEGRGRINKSKVLESGAGCAWTENCSKCYGTGKVQVAITNGDRMRELDNEGIRKTIRGLMTVAVYSAPPVRVLNIEKDDELQEWLDKESNEQDYIIFEGGFD